MAKIYLISKAKVLSVTVWNFAWNYRSVTARAYTSNFAIYLRDVFIFPSYMDRA